jgi:hypothetical protein
MPVHALPECARYSSCRVEVSPPAGRARACLRRARFMVDCPGAPAVSTCPRHVQMAVMQQAWITLPSGG